MGAMKNLSILIDEAEEHLARHELACAEWDTEEAWDTAGQALDTLKDIIAELKG